MIYDFHYKEQGYKFRQTASETHQMFKTIIDGSAMWRTQTVELFFSVDVGKLIVGAGIQVVPPQVA
jgi:hypothetical protein